MSRRSRSLGLRVALVRARAVSSTALVLALSCAPQSSRTPEDAPANDPHARAQAASEVNGPNGAAQAREQPLETSPAGAAEGSEAAGPLQPAGEPQGGKGEQAASGEKSEPSHCPSGMILVEGEYCSKVEHKCVKDWYAKANDKQVCEAFEPWSKCVGDKTKKRYCIDKFSWPNQEGERPEVMNNFYQAQLKCAALGKRLCTESEWTMACEGPEMKPFPYGYVRDPKKCNGDKLWDNPNMNLVAKRDPTELARLWQGVRSGSQAECVSDYGVHDLPANNDEVVASETYGSGYKGKYDSVHTGGPWYRGVRNQCRPKIYTHNEGFYYYFLGFRCCAEPDGAPTDPRTPKQIKRGEGLEKTERLARFSVEEMKHKLELKRKGQCTCDASDALCKTMCGTLLGPEAKDHPPGPPAPSK